MKEFDLPTFSEMDPDQFLNDIQKLIEQCKTTIETQLSFDKVTWDTVMVPIEESTDALKRYWSTIAHLNAVVSSEKLRQAHDMCLPYLAEFSSWMTFHPGLYRAYCELKNNDSEFTSLSMEKQKAVKDSIRSFELFGVSLGEEKKKRFLALSTRISALESKFKNNLLDATHGWTKLVSDKHQLSGLPESVVAAAQQAADEKGLQGWLFTLNIPSYMAVMLHADDEALRHEMYIARTTRASDCGPDAGKWDNTPVIDELLALREEKAHLLGFQNFAELSLANKMAESTQQVNQFLDDLAARSKPQAQAELQEIRDLAANKYGKHDLQSWDFEYYGEKIKQRRFDINDEVLKPYFPIEKVLSGLFEIVRRLFGMSITEVDRQEIDMWHPDVRFFAIRDAQGELRGGFYLDLYTRENKRSSAWIEECRIRRRRADGSIQYPVAFLNCNLSGPVGDKPALFTHKEIVSLFHEFGHGLHHLLTRAEISAVSGINGVPWDAIEFPSQFLENWCWQKEGVALFSAHYQTQMQLPDELLNKLLEARNFNAAMRMVNQLEFSLFDFRLHEQYRSDPVTNVQQVLDRIRFELDVDIPPTSNRFQNSFEHIFGGEYAAGYYSYKWAGVMSSDAFSVFEEQGILNSAVGARFLRCILEPGGSEEPLTLFTEFRSRKPEIDALLRHSGII